MIFSLEQGTRSVHCGLAIKLVKIYMKNPNNCRIQSTMRPNYPTKMSRVGNSVVWEIGVYADIWPKWFLVTYRKFEMALEKASVKLIG